VVRYVYRCLALGIPADTFAVSPGHRRDTVVRIGFTRIKRARNLSNVSAFGFDLYADADRSDPADQVVFLQA
jgi:hypothetical protein